MTQQSDPKYLDLGPGFADYVHPAPFPKATLRFRNERAAAEIGLETLNDNDWVTHFCRFQSFADNIPQPLAMRYHGHQFRHYNPQLGDGRGFLFAQFRDAQNRLMDLGTKGSGMTPYSRGGDGKLTLKGAVREVLASEMLEALGATTSRTFSIVETGESLVRGDEPSPTRSAVLVRLNHGHIRVGTFQYHAYHRDDTRLIALVDYCLQHYFNESPSGSETDRILRFLSFVRARLAQQAAELMVSGFVHGVLNTDNINITGEIFDFGPWRFLPHMDLNFTAAYFDETGLYAYGRQADNIHWTLYQLAACFIEKIEEPILRKTLEPFGAELSTQLREGLIKRLGVKPGTQTEDENLTQDLNQFMVETKAPFERIFFDWFGGQDAPTAQIWRENNLYQNPEFHSVFVNLARRQPLRPNIRTNTYHQGDAPCTILIDEVENIWAAIADQDDWSPFENKIRAIRHMGDALNA